MKQIYHNNVLAVKTKDKEYFKPQLKNFHGCNPLDMYIKSENNLAIWKVHWLDAD